MSAPSSAVSAADDVWLGIDLGTQSVKALAVGGGVILASASHPLASRRAGREHTQDPWAWWQAVAACCRQITSSVSPERFRGVAFDATSGTVLLTDRNLQPASEALMYDDSRASEEAQAVEAAGAPLWRELGYRFQASWALPKVLWLARKGNVSALGSLRLTHQNDFIHQCLAGRAVATDWSHSLKTGYDFLRLRWPFEAFELLGLPCSLFPEVVAPGTVIAAVSQKASAETGLPAGLPILAGMTDGCAAQIASGTVEVGSWNAVIGTTLVLKGVTAERLVDPLGVVYSHRARDGSWLPGGASSTGAGILSKELPGADLDALSRAAVLRGPSAVVTYPLAGRGERFPFQAPEAQGFSLGQPADQVEQYRAILQGVAFLERLSFDYLEMLGAPLDGTFTISGGAVRSPLWNELRATILQRPLTLPAVTESALGMAVLAAAGEAPLAAAARRMIQPGTVIEPREHFAEVYGAGYCSLLRALRERGWLGAEVAAYAVAKVSRAAGGAL